MTTRALREQLLALPLSDRLALVQDLWDSIAEDQHSLPVSEDHAQTIDQRLSAHEAKPRDVVSWDDAKAELRRQVQRRSSTSEK